MARFLSHCEVGSIEWIDHKGAKISAYIAYSKLTPQHGFHSYTSSQRDGEPRLFVCYIDL